MSQGYDFSVPLGALIIGPHEFTQSLTSAEVIGVAYGRDQINGMLIPIISLCARNKERLENAFQEFHEWGGGIDGDSVKLTIVYLEQGGYLLGISPEMSRLLRRTFGYSTSTSPIIAMATWVKKIDSRNPELDKLRRYTENKVSPCLLTGLHFKGELDPNKAERLNLPDIAPIFNLEFFSENDIDSKKTWCPHAELMLKTHRKGNIEEKKDRTNKNKKDRIDFMLSHFPVTIAMTKSNEKIKKIYEELKQKKVPEFIIDQAVCNLTASFRIFDGKLHYPSTNFDSIGKSLSQYLAINKEDVSKKQILETLNSATIERQIILDLAFLLRINEITIENPSLEKTIQTAANNDLL